MRVLVTGGSGYIGAHLVRLLLARGDTVAVVDDLVGGSSDRIEGARIFQMDIAESEAITKLSSILTEEKIETVVHLAARKKIDESIERPLWYFQQNVGGMANLLAAMQEAAVASLVFSSTAAVYAESGVPVIEESPTVPLNPYGQSKLVGEWMARAMSSSRSFKSTCLRYFNVAGAQSPELGDSAVTNLIPMVIERILEGKPPLIFGDDYSTPDGTCVRDFVHVQDVAEAHLVAIDNLSTSMRGNSIYNLGTGKGTSVRQVVDAVLKISGSALVPEVSSRRIGDIPKVIASVEKIRAELGWKSRFDLDDIVSSAWEAQQRV
ncbi:MAG: UDP-glucose 4-epimerase GalE [Cryobacterium sp.]|nr:UDP-glucose 4-epimerase GalE [Cryobacterium sp.]MCO5294611.1 UDP-glucose 4-epimerase GalE [Homoserinimonas sp.]